MISTHLNNVHDNGEVDSEREEAQGTQKTQDVIEEGQQQRDDCDNDHENGSAPPGTTSTRMASKKKECKSDPEYEDSAGLTKEINVKYSIQRCYGATKNVHRHKKCWSR